MIKFIIRTAISTLVAVVITYAADSFITRWRHRKFDLTEEVCHARQAVADTSKAFIAMVEQAGARLTNATADARIELGQSLPNSNTDQAAEANPASDNSARANHERKQP